MYKAHYTGKADKPGFRGLGVLVRGMSPDNLALEAVIRARQTGVCGRIQQQELAEILLANFNPVEVLACDNIVTGQDKLLWGSTQAVKNSLQDLVKNGLNAHHFIRCMRNGEAAGDKRAWGYYVTPWGSHHDDEDDGVDLYDIMSQIVDVTHVIG